MGWTPYGPLFNLTTPTLGDFSWVNQDDATATGEKNGIYLYDPAGTDWHALVKDTPSPPYSVTVGVLPLLNPRQTSNAYTSRIGLCWRQSADGKLVLFVLQAWGAFSDRALRCAVLNMNSPSSWSSTPLNVLAPLAGPMRWMRLRDDGTDRHVEVSLDSQNWLTLYGVTRTTFLTADQYGLCICANDPTYPCGMNVLSWKEE